MAVTKFSRKLQQIISLQSHNLYRNHIYTANQMTVFYSICNTGRKCVRTVSITDKNLFKALILIQRLIIILATFKQFWL